MRGVVGYDLAHVNAERHPMESVATQLHVALPHLSACGHTIIAALSASAGRIPSADVFAVHCGLHNRHELARLLRRDGLPQIEELAGWVTVLTLLWQREISGWSLYKWAMEMSQPPPTCYRTVKRVTGTTWRHVTAAGFRGLLERFVARCQNLQVVTGGGARFGPTSAFNSLTEVVDVRRC
jgi:hypothetical protein